MLGSTHQESRNGIPRLNENCQIQSAEMRRWEIDKGIHDHAGCRVLLNFLMCLANPDNKQCNTKHDRQEVLLYAGC